MSAVVAICSGILAAPCAITLILTPLGLSGLVAALGGAWFDANRAWFAVVTVILIVLTHLVYRRVRQVRSELTRRMGLDLPDNPWDRRIVWLATLVPLALIALEFIIDQR